MIVPKRRKVLNKVRFIFKLSRPVKQAEAEWVVQKLADMVADMEPGDRLPKRAELMDRFQASERQVLHALHVLHDRGKIVRGIGREILLRTPIDLNRSPHPGPSLIAADSRTIIAVANPDHSFFDQCMRTLFRHVETESMQLACRFVDPKTARDLHHAILDSQPSRLRRFQPKPGAARRSTASGRKPRGRAGRAIGELP